MFTAVVLTGGLGTRLSPVVSGLPKCLAVINGRPFLSYLLDQLDSSSIKKVVLCTGFLGELVEKEFGEAYKSLKIQYSREITPLGTGGALRNALGIVSSDSILVMNGDSYCDMDLLNLMGWFLDNKLEAGMVLVKVSDAGRFGSVRFDEKEYILSYEEKTGEHAPGWINAGVYIFKKDFLKKMPCKETFSIENEFLPVLASNNNLKGFLSESQFIDIGTPESYIAAQKFFAKNKI